MAAFTVCALVFAAWIAIRAKGWPRGLRLSLDGHASDGDGGPHGHAGDDGGDCGGGDGGGD